LIDIGRTFEALQLENELGAARSNSATAATDNNNDADEHEHGNNERKDKKREMIIAQARAMDIILDSKLGLGNNNNNNNNNNDGVDITLTSHERSIRRQILKEFQSACAKTIKCANCSGFSPKIRHDQFNKIFQVPLSIRNKRANITEGVRIRSACRTLGIGDDDDDDDEEGRDEAMPDSEDEIDDDDQDDDQDGVVDNEAREGMSTTTKDTTNNKTTKKKQDEFMNTLEIEAQCRLTWEKQSFLCSKFFGSAHAPDIFGSRSSNTHSDVDRAYISDDDDDEDEIMNDQHLRRSGGRRSGRPRSNSTTSNAEQRALGNSSSSGHGYTIFFIRVIPVPPSRFRPPVVMGSMTIEHSQNYYLSKVIEINAQLRTLFNVTLELTREESALKLGNNNAGMDSSSNKQLRKVRDERERTQANSIRLWVDLQTAINCYMDSTRDPKGTSGLAPNGIRQLLEKKEGIFRKHMMGKRVNFACRSVISPDPYIGTNEIGLPLHFARTLTFPTPVTNLNVAEMRELVRRGPADYPGAGWVEFPTGQRVDLSKMKERGRNAIAARLLSASGGSGGGMGVVKVGRQLRDGDMVLMNRQVRESPNCAIVYGRGWRRKCVSNDEIF
jgi:DNA-directed RNA polymerase I subunit RPA1